ncbi:hypothetical protein EVAR_35452_1 [Eumeta japonica]|uniref:Uncharacterized protein n=1 Tax=Eumeta variegata TaxID=151549 RepID=A0A4C1Z8W2_EUMVA|nr:hypothetical protein EVAR_35452_1 [Eumeta japonica]
MTDQTLSKFSDLLYTNICLHTDCNINAHVDNGLSIVDDKALVPNVYMRVLLQPTADRAGTSHTHDHPVLDESQPSILDNRQTKVRGVILTRTLVLC